MTTNPASSEIEAVTDPVAILDKFKPIIADADISYKFAPLPLYSPEKLPVNEPVATPINVPVTNPSKVPDIDPVKDPVIDPVKDPNKSPLPDKYDDVAA